MPAKGHKLSEEAKRRVSLAQKGRKHSPQEGFKNGHKVFSDKGRFKKGDKPWNTGKSGVYKKDVLDNWSKKRKGVKLTQETIEKIVSKTTGLKRTEETKRKISVSNKGKNCGPRGEKAWNWKGGITPEVNKIRNSVEYKIWQYAVFSRDNFTCQKSKIRGGKLTAHHIKNFSHFPELRFAIDNGITFSQDEHKQFHKKYGRKNNNKEQIIEFLCL